jgi:DNA-directed RNA polymerase subunit beta'
MSEIDGVVSLGEKRRGRRTIIVKNESGMEREHLVPHGKHLRVHAGDFVRAGEPLVDGPMIPQDILRINGEEALQQYLLRDIQSVYRSFGVPIDDKHVEIIISQMMRKVQVENPGSSDFLPGALEDKFVVRMTNDELRKKRKKAATFSPLLMGITNASLQSESWLSAASFQETTKVLTEAALAGKVDELQGLKENVLLGHLIPAGTGFNSYQRSHLKKNVDEALRMPAAEEEKLVPEGPAMSKSAG